MTEEVNNKKELMTTDERGLFQVNTLESQLQFASVLLKNGAINQSFKTPQQVVIAIHYAIALKLDPRIALNMMYVVNGKPSLYGDAPLNLARSSGKMKMFREYFIAKDGVEICAKNKNLNLPVYAAVCEAQRDGEDGIQSDSFSIDEQKAAGLNSPVWNKYQKTMLRYRARSMALKAKFSDILGGMDIAEYVGDNVPSQGIVQATSVSAEDLNKIVEEELKKEEPIVPSPKVSYDEAAATGAAKPKSVRDVSFKMEL